MDIKLQNSLLDGMDIMTKKAASKATSDLTIECEIVAIKDSAKGIYTVRYTENKFTAHSSGDVSYAIGDSVYVLVPQNDFEKEKIILGLTKATVLRAENQDINYYNEISENLLEDIEEIELCTYHSEEKDVLFKDDFIGAIIENFQKFVFEFDVRTNIVDLAQRVGGNYGVTISIPIVNDAGEQSSIDRVIDINNMNGNVYNFEDFITQRVYFDCDGSKYDPSKKIKVTAFVKDFMQNDEIFTPDIFIKNIGLKAVELLTDEEVKGYFFTIKSSEGYLFLKGKYESDKILTPSLRINGSSADAREYECYWFKEDASVDIDSEYYNANGGRGWRILNPRHQLEVNSDGTAIYDYNTRSYSYTVSESDIITSAKYKCVLVNSEIKLHKIVTIKNLNSNLSFSLETTSGFTSYVKDVGVVNLVAKLHYPGSTEDIIFDYLFQRFDKDGNYLDNDFYTRIEWDKAEGEDRYTQVSFPVGNIDELNTIKCEFVRKRIQDNDVIYESIGTSSITITTGREMFDYYLSVTNEDILYKYDANGNSPMIANYDGPYQSKVSKIEPINIRVFKTTGDELDTSEYNYLDTTWSFPKNSMMNLEGYDLEELEQDNDYYYVKGKNITSLSYSIKELYNNNLLDNTILISIAFDGVELKDKATIKFLKDGESGTNGSQYAAVIKYNINDDQGQPRWYAYGEHDKRDLPQKIRLVYTEDGWQRYLNNSTITEENLYVDFGNPLFTVELYKNGKLIPYDAANPIYSVSWDMLDTNDTDPFFEITEAENSINGILKIKSNWENAEDISVNIVQASITINESQDITTGNEYVFAYYPIDIVRLDSDQKFMPEIADGYDSVLFDSDGTNPQYNTNKKFRVNVVDGLNDFFDCSWYSSETLIENEYDYEYEADYSFDILKRSFRPVSQLNDGANKNYLMVKLTQTNEKVLELDTIAAAALQQKISLNKQIDYYSKEYDYLRLFLNKFDYDAFKARLDSCEIYLAYRSKYLSILFDLLSILENIENVDDNFNYTEKKDQLKAIITDILNAENVDDITTYTDKIETNTSITDPEIVNLISSFNRIIDEGITAYENLTGYRDFDSELDAYNSFVESVQALPAEMSKICSEESESISENYKEFSKIKNQINLYGYYFRDITKEYTKKNMIDILGYINDLLIKYKDNTYIFNYYNDKNKELNKQLDKQNNILAKSEQSVFDTAIVIKPILFLINRYGLASLNGWDGNKIYTGDRNEYILAPQIGAGKKENGLFTGVVMGVKKTNSPDNDKIGLFGFNTGKQSIFLDAKTGGAYFGVSGEGQIQMIPGGTSRIAGWEIEESSLGKKYGNFGVYLHSKEDHFVTPPLPDETGGYFQDEKYIAFEAYDDTDGEENRKQTYITYDGYLYSNQAYIEGNLRANAGYIGGWSILDRGIEAINDDKSKAFIRAGKENVDDTSTGFYLSAYALAIGDSESYLKFDSKGLSIKGEIRADSGQIGPFNVNEEYIWTNFGSSNSNSSINFILGEEGICLGGYGKFYLGKNYVGRGITIKDYTYQGGTIIHSNGGIQTDYLTIMNNSPIQGQLPKPQVAGIYMDLIQGKYPSRPGQGTSQSTYPLQLRLIGCTNSNNPVLDSYIGLWSEGRLIVGKRDFGFRINGDDIGGPFYAAKVCIDGGLYVDSHILCRFGSSIAYRLKLKENDGIKYVVAEEYADYDSTDGDAPSIPDDNSGNTFFSESPDIITFSNDNLRFDD